MWRQAWRERRGLFSLQGEVVSGKQSAGSSAWGWAYLAGARWKRKPGGSGIREAIRRKWGLGVGMPRWGSAGTPHIRSPPEGGFEKGEFPLYLFPLFFSRRMSVLYRFFTRPAHRYAFHYSFKTERKKRTKQLNPLPTATLTLYSSPSN